METKDKRVKREIANSNERRRMQSINAGFQKLKRLLPVSDGEKLSKASILQHAAEFIQQIEREKLILHDQNTLLRGTLMEIKGGTASLDSIDLDSLPNIPINTHIAINTTTSNSNNNNNNADSSSTDNSNDDCSKEAHSNTNTTTTTTTTTGGNKNTTTHNNGKIISSNNNDNNNYHELAQLPISSVAEIISDRVSSPNGLVSTGVAKAAIALPLEVPYTSETAIIHHDLHPPPTKMVKLEPITITPATTTLNTSNSNNSTTTTTTTNTTTLDPQDPPRTGQNLETICKAIMEIEGERVFTDENIKHEAT